MAQYEVINIAKIAKVPVRMITKLQDLEEVKCDHDKWMMCKLYISMRSALAIDCIIVTLCIHM